MSRGTHSVAVLVSAGCHPTTGTPRAARGDGTALGVAKRVAGDDMRVLHAGSKDEPALRDYLALGAECIEVIAFREGADLATALAPLLTDTDLVITGSRAERGAGSGLLPYALAQILGRPVITNVLDVEVRGGEAYVLQFLPRGKRRRIAVTLPAVLAVHPLASSETAYAYARLRSGRIVEAALSSADPAAATQCSWTIWSEARPIVRLKAGDKKPAHERLMSAIAAEQKKGVVIADGTPAVKARAVLDYLRRHRLIDF